MTSKRIRLTDQSVRKLPVPEEHARITYDLDLPGFGVRVTPAGVKSFVYVYRSPETGQSRTYTIGRFTNGHDNRWPAAKARKEVVKFRRTHADPAGDRQAKRLEIEADRRAETMNQLCDRYIAEHVKPNKRPRSVHDDLLVINSYVRPVLGQIKVKALTRDDLRRFHKHITEGRLPNQRGPAPYRANAVMRLVRHMLSMALVEWGLRPDNPAVGFKMNPERARVNTLDQDSVRRLCAAAGEHPNQQSADALMLLLLTGCRRNEVLGAEWSEFDLDKGIWEIPTERKKSKRPHRIVLSQQALAILRRRRAEMKGQFVFPAPNGHGPQKDLRHFFQAVCQKAGIERFRLHDIRHSVASILYNSGATYEQIGQVLGHSTPQVTMRYSHFFEDRQRELADTVGDFVLSAANGE
jgi:integrase